jgi:hypothetical protein
MKIRSVFCYLLVLPFLLAGMQTAQATLITFDMNYEFSGGTPPESSTTPWIRATFDDGGSAGSVKLTMEAVNLTDEEYVNEWYFNYSGSAAALSINLDSTNGVGIPLSFQSATQAYKADGDGRYNFYFDFANSGDDRFMQGESIAYNITFSGLVAGDFEFLSLDEGGHGPFYSAAHVGGWIAPVGGTTPIPEPASMLLLGAGLLGLAGFGRKRLKQ